MLNRPRLNGGKLWQSEEWVRNRRGQIVDGGLIAHRGPAQVLRGDGIQILAHTEPRASVADIGYFHPHTLRQFMLDIHGPALRISWVPVRPEKANGLSKKCLQSLRCSRSVS